MLTESLTNDQAQTLESDYPLKLDQLTVDNESFSEVSNKPKLTPDKTFSTFFHQKQRTQ
jgi:hypothetical protein